MKNLLLALVVLAGSGLALAQSADIEGSWGAQQSDNGFLFDVTFTISHDSTSLTNVCTHDGVSVTAHATVPSSYDGQTLNFLGSAQDHESLNGLNCNIDIHMDSINYSIQGNVMTVSHAGSTETYMLTRR